MTINIKEIFTKAYLKEYIFRNRNLFLISLIIFVVSAIVGVFISDLIREFMIEIFNQLIGNLPPNSCVADEAIFLFTNNIRANILILLGGFVFSIFSIFSIILNGIVLGFTYTLVNPLQFFVGIAPHGIFELTATIMSLMGAFIITKLEINLIDALFKHEFREELHNSSLLIKDIILTFIITSILLVVAAIIEAGITPILLSMVS